MHQSRLPAGRAKAGAPGVGTLEKGVTPSVGLPLDLVNSAYHAINNLMSMSGMEVGLPATTLDIIRDAVVWAYQQGRAEADAEHALLHDAVDAVHDRRQDLTTDVLIKMCMKATKTEVLDICMDDVGLIADNSLLVATYNENNNSVTYRLTPKQEGAQ